jgi:hypothetical protein
MGCLPYARNAFPSVNVANAISAGTLQPATAAAHPLVRSLSGACTMRSNSEFSLLNANLVVPTG